MKRVKKPVFFVVALLILALVVTSLFGVYGQHGDFKVTYIKGAGDIRWGIDIRGGVEATFSPADGVEATTEQLEAAKEIIETRMVSQSITDYEIYTDPTNNRIIVRFPWRSDEQDYDPEAAIDELAATAQLTFRQGMEYETSEYAEDGSIVYRTPSGTTAENIILEGSDVVTAEPRMTQDETTGEYQYVVALTLSDEGAQKFAQATTAMVGETISIWMDDVMLSAPKVNEAITTGECVITGDFTSEESTQLAARIQAGALPFALQVSSFSSMPPTLGAQALDAMLLAGIIAFVVISLLMIVIFRLPGVVAVISLAGQVVYGRHLRLLPLPQLLHHDAAWPGGHCALHRHGRGRKRHLRQPHPRGAEGRQDVGRRLEAGLLRELLGHLRRQHHHPDRGGYAHGRVWPQQHLVHHLRRVHHRRHLLLWLYPAGGHHRQLHHGHDGHPPDDPLPCRLQRPA